MGKLENELIDAESTNLESMISAYSIHRQALVRMTVLDNPNISKAVIQEMLSDRNEEIRRKAGNKLTLIESVSELDQSEADSSFVKCFDCGEPTQSGDNYCRSCGSEVSISGPYCKTCELEREEDSLYCRMCGDKLLLIKAS